MIQPIDYFLVAWFVLVAISTIWVGVDQFRHNPEPAVMKWGFILVTLYLGPIGALLYVLADKEPRPGEHEEFTRPLWKQGIGSTIHCVAGDRCSSSSSCGRLRSPRERSRGRRCASGSGCCRSLGCSPSFRRGSP